MRKGRRAFAIFMAMVMVIALLPTAAFAQDDGAVDSGETLGVENTAGSVDVPETVDTADADVDDGEEADDSFGGFAGDDEFAVEPDDGFAEDETPVEDEVSAEDSELAEDIAEAGIMLRAAVLPALELGKVTVSFVDMKGNSLPGGDSFIIENYKNTTVTAETLRANGIDLTGSGNYTVMKYNMTVRTGKTLHPTEESTEFIEAKAGSWHEVSYKVFVITASNTPGATITLDIQFVDENGDAIISRPDGYAISYTAKLGADWQFLPEETYTIDGEITLKKPVYSANSDYQTRITIVKAKNTEMTGYAFDRMEIGEFSATGAVWAVTEEIVPGIAPNTYEAAQYALETLDKGTLTIINHYTKVDTYTVTWYGFANEEFCTATVNKGEPLPEEYKTSCPEGEPYNETYAFGGWNEPVQEADGNYTITSKWIDPHRVTIDGATTQTVKHNTTATKPTFEPTKEGHTFGFWTLDGENAFDWSTPITENITLSVKWIPEKRTVTWMDGDTKVAETEVDYGTTATAPEEELVNDGYRFGGWLNGESDFDLETAITEDITLNAKWIKQVTHTWLNGEETVKSETADEGAEVEAPANPTRSGYTFNGWSSSTDEWGNVTYTAQWRANSTGGGGTGGGGSTGGGDNTGDNTGGDNTGGNGGETIGGGEGGEDPADDNNGGLVDIGDDDTALADRPFTFIDVTKNDWFYDAVYAAWEKGLMNGTTATTFEPNAMTTRGMLVAILYRMEGSPEVVSPNSFSDVAEDMYYTEAVAWAAANGIVNGYDDDRFGPDDVLLREQTAAILYRYAEYKGMDITTDGALAFDDADMISDYAQDAMLWAVSVELMNGMDENTLAPQDGTQRSHMATLLTRLVAMTEAKDDTKEG